MFEQELQQKILRAFFDSFNWSPDQVDLVRPDPRFGDVAMACHPFSRELKKSPQEIAETIADRIASDDIASLDATAGYINIRFSPAYLAEQILGPIVEHGNNFGTTKNFPEKIAFEYSSPNTNKPLHLGHIRNNVLGMAISNMFLSQGADVIRVQIINDRGIHIIKSMVAYQKWGDGKTPEEAGEKGDHYVGKFYVMFEKEFEREWQQWLTEHPEVPGLADDARARRRQEFFGESRIGQEAQEMLRQWESGDDAVRALWQMMNEWVYEGFKATYKKLGSEFDKDYYESETYLLGKEIIKAGLETGTFYKEADGSVWIDLTEDGLDKKLVARKDGTSVYITQDLGLAVARQKELGFDRMIYVVGHEQEYHFKVLFKILEKLGHEWASHLYHLSYGLVFLPEGKMKSREGKVVDADDIIEEVQSLARGEIKKRFPDIADVELSERGQMIGLGALKFLLLQVTPTQSIKYNPAEAISFEGSTGPYVQYTHARLSSVLEEETPLPVSDLDLSLLSSEAEREVILALSDYSRMLEQGTTDRNPSSVCNYLITLSQRVNTFYHSCHILKAETDELKQARLLLAKASQIVLRNGLGLLGIEAPEKM